MMNSDKIADLLFPKRVASDNFVWGSLKSINADGSYQVQINASSVTTKASPCCSAEVGDRVLILIKADGKCVAVGRLGGDLGGVGEESAPALMQAHTVEQFTMTGEPQQAVFTKSSGQDPMGYLTLEDGFVVCHKDGDVLVSAMLYVYSGAEVGDRVIANIKRDGYIWSFYFRSSGLYEMFSVPPLHLTVKAGQKLSLWAYNGTGNRGVVQGTLSTRLVVQYLDAVATSGGGGGGISSEEDPTVPDWAKQPNPPTYSADDVGADAKGSASAALQSANAYTDGQIAAIPTPDVSGQIGTHNTATDAHNDIRLLLDELTSRLNALADSDDTTLDQLSEVVAYIKANRGLIESVTTSKVNVTDIVDNMTTNVGNKPLSAAQGVALKALIDAITVPTKLGQLENDVGYLKTADKTSLINETIIALGKQGLAPRINLDKGQLYAAAASAYYTPISVAEGSVNFYYYGGSGCEQILFPITGLVPGTTYKLTFTETYNGGFIGDTYQYGCGIMQKSEYNNANFPLNSGIISQVKWTIAQTGTHGSTLTFTPTSNTAYWLWNMSRCNDNTKHNITFTASLSIV